VSAAGAVSAAGTAGRALPPPGLPAPTESDTPRAYAPRRPGDIMTMIADTSRIRGVLDWTPRYDDLETIARHALAWEEKSFRERHGEVQHAASA